MNACENASLMFLFTVLVLLSFLFRL